MGKDVKEVNECRKQLGVRENVRSPMTPTKRVHFLGIFNDRHMKSTRKKVIGWENKDVWVWERASWEHNGDMKHKGVTHLNFLRTIERYFGCIWERVD
jgi:hypothetical protein